MDTFCPLFTTMSNIYEIVSIIYNFFWSYLTSCLHRFLLYFFLLFLIYLNSIFHKVVNMRHFSTHPYSKRKNNWILKISFLESPCSILSSYILFFFFFWSDRVRVDFDHFCEATTILHKVAPMLHSSSEIFCQIFPYCFIIYK